MSKKMKPALDKYSYHEALDRAYFICNIAETFLGEHPVIKKHKNIKKKINKAITELAEAYQMIGSLEETFPKKT
jgi:hypothetical protein